MCTVNRKCGICGRKSAGRAGGKSFGAAVVGRDENDRPFEVKTKKLARRLRRTRENRNWRKEL